MEWFEMNQEIEPIFDALIEYMWNMELPESARTLSEAIVINGEYPSKEQVESVLKDWFGFEQIKRKPGRPKKFSSESSDDDFIGCWYISKAGKSAIGAELGTAQGN
jgi:hypothetical protein